MAPDKIFRTTTYLDNDKGKVVWKETPVNGAENIAYIRKDALIEWMDKNIKNLNVLFGEIFIAKVKDKLKQL